MAGILVPPLKLSSSTTITPRSTAVTTFQGNTGGLTIKGGTASGDDLTLQSTSDATKGTLFFDDAVDLWTSYPDNTNLSSPTPLLFGATFADTSGQGLVLRVFDVNPTYTNTAATVATQLTAVMGRGTYNYAVNPTFTNLFQLFIAQPVINMTGTGVVTTNWSILSQQTINSASTVAAGTTNQLYSYEENSILGSTGASGSARWANFTAFKFSPRMTSGTGGGTPSVTTIDTSRGLHVVSVVKSGAGTNTLTNQIGADFEALANGVNNIGVRSAITAGANNYFLQDTGGAQVSLAGLVTKYNNISTVSNGIPSELATIDLTALSAAKVATALYTPTVAGMFRITVVITLTRASSGTSTLAGTAAGQQGFSVTFKTGDGSTTITQTIPLITQAVTTAFVETTTANTVGTTLIGSETIYTDASAITYDVGYTSVGVTSMQFSIHVKLEAL